MQVLIFQLLFLLLICHHHATGMLCTRQGAELTACNDLKFCVHHWRYNTALNHTCTWHYMDNYGNVTGTILWYAVQKKLFCMCSYCCSGLQTGLFWGDPDLHLRCQPGVCSGLDCWAIPQRQYSYIWFLLGSTPIERSVHCRGVSLPQCDNINWLCGHVHKYYQPHDCPRWYSGWHDLHTEIHCCNKAEWDSGAVQRKDCKWISNNKS